MKPHVTNLGAGFAGPKPVGTYEAPTLERRADKALFGSSRRARWFGL